MVYSVGDVLHNTDSAVNQHIIDKLVGREVYCCMTQEVEYMLSRVSFYDDENPLDESVYDDIAVYDEDEEPVEIYEWWAVSDWFGRKLKERGQPVIEFVWGKSYWGRTCTGQSISLDWCVADIARDMGILEGMQYCWAET